MVHVVLQQTMGDMDPGMMIDAMMKMGSVAVVLVILAVGIRFFSENADDGMKDMLCWVIAAPFLLILSPIAGPWWYLRRKKRIRKAIEQHMSAVNEALAKRNSFDDWLHDQLLIAQIDEAAGCYGAGQRVANIGRAQVLNAEATLRLKGAFLSPSTDLAAKDLTDIQGEWDELKALAP